MKPLYKHTIVIWAEEDLGGAELNQIAREASDGMAYCSQQTSVLINSPELDPDWESTEFFGEEDDEDFWEDYWDEDYDDDDYAGEGLDA